MKKIIVILTLAGSMLYADAANAACSCKKKKVKRHTTAAVKKKTTNTCVASTKVKRETTDVFMGYRELPVTNTIIYETIREGVPVDPNSGIGRNSSDNYQGLINNGSMGANGTFPNGTCEMWVSSLDENSSKGQVLGVLNKCYK